MKCVPRPAATEKCKHTIHLEKNKHTYVCNADVHMTSNVFPDATEKCKNIIHLEKYTFKKYTYIRM